MGRIQSGVLLLCVVDGENCQLYLKVSPDLVEKGIHANTLIKSIADLVGGSGGGKRRWHKQVAKTLKG